MFVLPNEQTSLSTNRAPPAQTAGGPMATPAERFAAKVNTAGPWSLRHNAPGRCHHWTRDTTDKGYGRFWAAGRVTVAHRWAYAATYGEIPDGLEIDHRCRNRACVNPDHLEAVTHRVNVLRSSNVAALRAARTHCEPAGHPLTGENVRRRKNGTRQCRACEAARRAARATNPGKKAA
jgi:hypothetical protein